MGDVRDVHPTKALLLDTAVELIDEFGPQGFTVETLLDKSSISKGSLYHHFEDFGDLIDQAQIKRFSRYIDQDIEVLSREFLASTSREDLRRRIRSIVLGAHGPQRASARADRAVIVGSSLHSEKFMRSLAVEQQRLTDAIADVLRELQERGHAEKVVAPRVAATFVQAYSLGRILDDVADSPIGSEAWADVVMLALEGII